MTSDRLPQIEFLQRLGLEQDLAVRVLTGGLWFEEQGGTPLKSYWHGDSPSQRDELFLVANTAFALAHDTAIVSLEHSWAEHVSPAYLFFLRSLAQATRTVDLLVASRCYSDAFCVCRAVHSRVSLLLLFGLRPILFDVWMRSSDHQIFQDAKVRGELRSHGIRTMDHWYAFGSELVHGRFEGLSDTGHLTQGLFCRLPHLDNHIFVTLKFLLATAANAVLAVLEIDGAIQRHASTQELAHLFQWLRAQCLVPSRFDHLWTLVAPERHWKQLGKDRYLAGEFSDFDRYRQVLHEIHVGQTRKVGSKYLLNPDDV